MSTDDLASPEYNMILSGLLDVLLVQERFLTVSGMLEYVPVRADMHDKWRENIRENWQIQKARAMALDMVSKRIIWQVLPRLEEGTSLPMNCLQHLPLPNISSLELFQGMDLLEALWTVISKAGEYNKLLIPFVSGVEKALLKNELFTLLDFNKYFLAKFCELKGGLPESVNLSLEPASLSMKEVDDSLVPLLLNSMRALEQNNQDHFLKYFFFGNLTEEDKKYQFPKIDPKKREEARESLNMSRERDHDLMIYFMRLLARSPTEPLLPLREIKIDKELTQIHTNLREHVGKPLLFGFQNLVRLRARGYLKKMVWYALLNSNTFDKSIHRAVNSWSIQRYARTKLEDSALDQFTVETAKLVI